MRIERKKQYICESCGARFDSENECWKHEQTVHEGKKLVRVVALYYSPEDDCFGHYVEDGFVSSTTDVTDYYISCEMFGNIKWHTCCEPTGKAVKAALARLFVEAEEWIKARAESLECYRKCHGEKFE